MEQIHVIDLREGNIVFIDGKTDPMIVIKKHSPVKKARGLANISIEFRNIKTGAKFPYSTTTNKKVTRLYIEEKIVQYMFHDKDNIHVMDDECNTLEIPTSCLGEEIELLSNDIGNITVKMHNSEILSVSLPQTMTVTVQDTAKYIKGQTAKASYKPAVITQNIKINVPQFISIGDKILINTSDLSYIERVKS
ncbi:hypothetical protein GUI12_03770 [Anaplasmataceae bacterium AB001_6]|nr:hypothetical protein GUI12_03770 [Anaplasmataceae bacterium AB001_6]